jgi:hypothetical protein
VHELALNGTDVCVANFFTTEERRRLSSFTTPICMDQFKAFVRRLNATESSGFASIMQQPFSPFSTLTWLALCLTTIYFGVTMWLIEGGHSPCRLFATPLPQLTHSTAQHSTAQPWR